MTIMPFGVIDKMSKFHPYNEVGDSRICPITGKTFYMCWSEKTTFDTCDSCKPDAPALQKRLSELNQERKEKR